MMLEGTVVNGVVVLNCGAQLAEGAKVRVEVDDEDDVGPPPSTETYEEHLAILRQSIQDAKDGLGQPLAEFAAELKKEYGLPPDTGK